MVPWATKLLLALDAGSVQAAGLVPTWRGRTVRGLARRPLASGALVPTALETNVRRPEEVREAIRGVLSDLGGAPRPTILVLPDGIARGILVDVPAGTDAREYARFRLGSELPFPVSDAVVDVLPVGGGRVLAAAVRRSVAAEYEGLLVASGLPQDRLDLASLGALAVLQRQGAPDPHLDLVLGEAAFSIALMGRGTALAFRTRRRDPGPDEADRLALELARTAQLGQVDAALVRVVGPGARRLAEAWTARGTSVRPGWGRLGRLAVPEAEELAFLGAGLG
jgi:hypothetical protein